MNDFIEKLKSRRSCRSYKATPVPRELIEQIAEAGTFAPTGRGAQSPIIIAVTKPELVCRLSRLNAAAVGMPEGSDPFYGAPVVLVVLADKAIATHVYDGSLVMGNLLLAASELGLGACWIHRAREVFESDEGKAILREIGIEGDYEGIGNCILGYPAAPAPEPKPRKSNYIYFV